MPPVTTGAVTCQLVAALLRRRRSRVHCLAELHVICNLLLVSARACAVLFFPGARVRVLRAEHDTAYAGWLV